MGRVIMSGVAPLLTAPHGVSVYGVEWDWTTESSGAQKGIRTDDAAAFGEPKPALNNGGGSSPFDNLYPWCDMVVENRAGGVEVKEPKYWFKWTKNGKKLKIQIADGPAAGFSVDPVNRDRGDGKGELDFSYIGRYHCGSDYKSTTGVAPLSNITKSEARTGIRNLGSNFYQIDFAQFWYISMLFLVEFAVWNDAVIGRGGGKVPQLLNNGFTDSMGYHTGTTEESRTDYFGVTQYRNIEGWWNAVFDFLDGCYLNDQNLYIINNPNNFSDASKGALVGKPVSGYPLVFTIPMATGLEWALFPSKECDWSIFPPKYPVPNWWGSFAARDNTLIHGSDLNDDGYQTQGAFYIASTDAEGSGNVGCRLQERPPKTAGGNR